MTEPGGTILVLGSANMDLIVRMPRLPRAGETMFGTSFDAVPGGKGLNQAIAASRAGAHVAFMGAVGRDAFGAHLRSCLEENGVSTNALVEVDQATGTAHISVLDDGENSIVVVSGANGAIRTLDQRARDEIEAARFLLAQFERPVDLIAEAFQLARSRGVRTVLTPAPVTAVDNDLLALVDILVPNAAEACELAETSDEVEAATRLSRLVGLVVMTRGSRGVLVAREGSVIAELPARTVEPVDATGAGDAFVGVLVARLDAGATLDDALTAANTAASISVTRPGASSSMPTWDEIAAAL